MARYGAIMYQQRNQWRSKAINGSMAKA